MTSNYINIKNITFNINEFFSRLLTPNSAISLSMSRFTCTLRNIHGALAIFFSKLSTISKSRIMPFAITSNDTLISTIIQT